MDLVRGVPAYKKTIAPVFNLVDFSYRSEI